MLSEKKKYKNPCLKDCKRYHLAMAHIPLNGPIPQQPAANPAHVQLQYILNHVAHFHQHNPYAGHFYPLTHPGQPQQYALPQGLQGHNLQPPHFTQPEHLPLQVPPQFAQRYPPPGPPPEQNVPGAHLNPQAAAPAKQRPNHEPRPGGKMK
jgi:hypothetical protein